MFMGAKILPKLPKNNLKWIAKARPFVGRIKRTFDWEPFWVDVYNDKSPNIVAVNARQTFKSTFGTDIIGCYATSHDNAEVTYVVDRSDRASAWSKQRFRKDTMIKNSMLAEFLPQGRAAVGEINLVNNSVVYVRTDENEYNNVQGMTNGVMVFDECQYQDLQFRTTALYTMTHTKGQSYYLGIGGEAGSEWYKMWKKSDQKEWIFDDPNWRDKLTFDEYGNFTNENPSKIVSGKWVSAHPENKEYSGYHMPQSIFARIPLTIHDAVHLYKTRPDVSIEFQRKYNPKSIVSSHVEGLFYKAMRRPITPEMVEACYDKSKMMLTGQQVREIKNNNRGGVSLFLGIDWGSGPAASKTVGTVIIYWKKTNRYELAFIDSRPEEHEYDQAAHFVKIFHEYGVDYCVADMGYGKDKVTLMQKGGYTSSGEKINGLGSGKVKGCWTSGNLTQETHSKKEEMDTDSSNMGKKLAHYTVDKSEIIQDFVDMLGTTVPDEDNFPVSQFIIPMQNDWECGFLVDDFCNTTRKDLAEDQENIVEDGRQKAKKEFNHPKDSMMSIIYCMIAKNKHSAGKFTMSVVSRRF